MDPHPGALTNYALKNQLSPMELHNALAQGQSKPRTPLGAGTGLVHHIKRFGNANYFVPPA